MYKNVSQTDEQIIDLLIKYGANVELVIDQLESSDSEYYGLGILKQKLEEKKAREQNLQEIASAARKKDSSNCLVS